MVVSSQGCECERDVDKKEVWKGHGNLIFISSTCLNELTAVPEW